MSTNACSWQTAGPPCRVPQQMGTMTMYNCSHLAHLECQKKGGEDDVRRVAGLEEDLVDLCGDAGGEVEGMQHEVANQDVVEDALQLLARHQDGNGHRVG